MSYPHRVKFHGQTLGLVWQTEDEAQDGQDTDGVLVRNGRIVSARTFGRG
jgi:hypothetical protein